MASNNLELNLRVNAETGQLEVLGSKFQKTAESAKATEKAFSGLSAEAGNLVKSMLPIASATAVLAFFSSAVKGAEEQNEALRRLRFTLESTGQSWSKNQETIESWSKAISASTRFSDSQALDSLDKLSRATGNLAQAQRASELAMGISVKTGKSLGETVDFVNGLINKNERSVMLAHREFGVFTEKATTAQQVLDELTRTFDKAAFSEQNLTSETAKLSNQWSQFKDHVGNALIPTLTSLLEFLNNIKWHAQELAVVIEDRFDKVTSKIGALVLSLSRITLGDFSGAKQALTGLNDHIEQISASTKAKLEGLQVAQTEAVVRHSDERIRVTQRETDEEFRLRKEANEKLADEETRRFQQWAQNREEQTRKIKDLEIELDRAMLSVGIQTADKRKKLIDVEEQAKIASLRRSAAASKQRDELETRIHQVAAAQRAEIDKQEMILKEQNALTAIGLAVQTLQVVNSLGEKNSSAERARAKALLALQQAIAIGWAWVNAEKAGPFGHVIAAAETALIIAQFAQQYKAIDRASKTQSADLGSIKIDNPVPGIDPLPIGSPGQISGDGSSPITAGSVGGGGSSVSAGNVINVGGVVVNIDFDRISIDNIKAITDGITDSVRRGTIEGVQLALTLKNSADANRNLAV